MILHLPYPKSVKLIDSRSVSPSVYVVFESIKASDGCNQVGPTFASKTATLPPGELSTIAPDGTTQSYNFADLPCPPASLQWDPDKPYAPRIAAPSYLMGLDPAFSNCIPGAAQGVDPPIPWHTADKATGYNLHKKAMAHIHPHAHAVPRAPQQTA